MKLTLELIRDFLDEYQGTVHWGMTALEQTGQEAVFGTSKQEVAARKQIQKTVSRAPKEFRGWYAMVYYQKQTEFEEEFLLFGRGEEFSENICGRGLVSVGKPSEIVMAHNDVLYFDAQIPIHELYLSIQRLYLKFDKWEESLQKSLQGSGSLEHLLLIGFEMFQNPIIVHDENFALLAGVNGGEEEQKIWKYDRENGNSMLAMDVLNDFKVNPDYLESMTTRGPALFPAATFGYPILYQNLYYRKRYRGRICVNERNRKIRPSDYYLLNYFSGILLDAFRRGKMIAYRQTLSLSRYLVRFMERENVDETDLERVVMQYGWTVHDSYFCACLMLEDRDIHTNSVQYYCNWFSEEIPDVCAFSYEKSIVVLANAASSGLTMADFRNRIAIMLRESLMKVGISSICTDLMKFYYMYRQAVCALEIGKRKQETFWSYCFDDYQVDFIFQNALHQFPAEFLCSKELFLLQEYDKTHTSQLYQTLKIYLENDRNLARTSELLDVHRSTLLYRIGRIKELIKVDLEDSAVRFRLWNSFWLMEESGE